MNTEAYVCVMLASLAGGLGGALVIWHRESARKAGASRSRKCFVAALGTVLSACALAGFSKAFHEFPRIHAMLVTILMTGWISMIHAVVRLPLPRLWLTLRPRELALSRSRWSGVQLFGELLRSTPLRHLGGPVYLAKERLDLSVVLRGMLDAEGVHTWALLVCGPWLLFWSVQDRWAPIACSLAVHVPLNIYPILHLRQARGRIEACLGRKRARVSGGAQAARR